MKRYKRFMDGVKASDTLNQRLRKLKAPAPKSPWTKYGAKAAALVLVFGLGWYGLNYLQTVNRQSFLEKAQVYCPEEPDVSYRPGPGTYEYADPRFEGMGVASFIVLPDIDYGDTGLSEAQTALDWDIPEGAFRRDMSREHIAYLLGGEDALSTHLDWDGYELTGWAAWYGNGDFWGAYIQGYAGELDHFTFAVTAEQLPPTCIVYPHSVEQDICGVTVTADGHDSVATPSGGVDASTRRVSFMRDGYGYRFDLTGTDRELAEKRVSRLVRLVADDGTRYLEWITDTMEPVMTANADGTATCMVCGETFPDRTHGDGSLSKHESETTICSICGQQFPVGEEKAHVHSFPGGDTTAPAVSADPSYGAPAVSAEPGYTCPECGERVPSGMAHDCAMCDGYPLPHICEICGRDYPVGSAHGHPFMGEGAETCPDCGASYPAGTDHQCEICGLLLAPDTQVCEVCGQTLPAGVEHSHQQEQHRGNHH